MSTLYEDLMEGFNEILDAQRAGKKLKTTMVSIPEVMHDTNREIERTRNEKNSWK